MEGAQVDDEVGECEGGEVEEAMLGGGGRLDGWVVWKCRYSWFGDVRNGLCTPIDI